MVQKIDGRIIAERINKDIAQKIYKLKGPRPNLAVILVGDREDSKLYVSLKERTGKIVGVDTHIYKLDQDITELKLLEVIGFLNEDSLIDGILVQLPLPKRINPNKIIAAINPLKDVDGFCPNHPDYLVSPVLSSILACLKEINFVTTNKSACVLYNSSVFGLSVKIMLEDLGMTVSLQKNLETADLLISSQGRPHHIKGIMIKKAAVIIDVGITKVQGKVQGDVDYEDVKTKASFITPVPGGIGPMTIAFLFKNTWEIFNRRREKS